MPLYNEPGLREWDVFKVFFLQILDKYGIQNNNHIAPDCTLISN